MINEIYTVKEASEHWNIPQETILSWIKAKRFHTNEIKDSSGIWLLTEEGIHRLLVIENLQQRIEEEQAN